ncbi:unnamed protein product [Caretta caretta]
MENQSSDLLQSALDDLLQEDFKRFKDKLSHSDFEGKGTIPRGRLENADRTDMKNLLMAFYGAAAAVDVTIDVFTQISFREAAAKLREEREKDYQKKYRDHIQEEYQVIEDRNARLGEHVSLDKRYTELLIVKEHRQREEREHEIITRGRRHAELMAQRTSHTKISVLFDPDRSRQSPRTVVLQGAAGIGKTMTARKIMLDWAAGKLYQKKFDYVFYINCRKINLFTEQKSVADLLLDNCPNRKGPIKEMFEKPEKLLFIIDGFDELSSLLDIDEVGLCTDPFENKPVKTVLCSLLRKKVLQKSFLLITTRPTALEKL